MAEGDALFRTVATLRRWLAGREVTDATSRVPGLAAERLVGRRVDTVEAFGTHVLVRLDSGQVLHTHLRMTGSWDLYAPGQEWRRPERQARLVLTCGDRVAVCFNAPVVELLTPAPEHAHPALMNLGPDVLGIPLDVEEIRRRARAGPPERAVGEILLDHRVVSGIANAWRCEALWDERHDPWKAVSELSDDELDHLVTTAGRLIGDNAGRGARRGRHRVYGRAGRPCPRCATPVEVRGDGEEAGAIYWCPRCQPPVR